MTLNELYADGMSREEQAYTLRRLAAHKATRMAECPCCGTRSHVSHDDGIMGSEWWCARCNEGWAEAA